MWCIVPAAGIGSRFGSNIPKQYSEIFQGITVLEYTLSKLIEFPRFEGIMVAIHQDDKYWNSLPISRHQKIFTCLGGSERSDSVRQALKNISNRFNISKNEWVMVHDAARPGITKILLEKLYLEVNQSTECGGILATRIADTIKSGLNGQVVKTIDRGNLWAAQTPQMFGLNQLLIALEKAAHDGFPVTDEASAIEALGYKPVLVESNASNFKITTQLDLVIMREMLRSS